MNIQSLEGFGVSKVIRLGNVQYLAKQFVTWLGTIYMLLGSRHQLGEPQILWNYCARTLY